MRPWTLGVFVSTLALSACGARTQLVPERRSDGGAGGGGASASSTTAATTTAATTSSGVGGAGGSAPLDCPALAVSGQPISYTSAAALHGARPALVRVNDTSVMAIFAREPINDPLNPPATLGDVVFDPWGLWPQSLGSVVQISSIGGVAFSAAEGLDDATAAVMYSLAPEGGPPEMFLAPRVKPGQFYDPSPDGVLWSSGGAGLPATLARGNEGHLAAAEVAFPTGSFLRLAHVSEAGQVVLFSDVACAEAPFPTDSLGVSAGYLVATADGRDFGACDDDNGIPGPAKHLRVLFVDPGGAPPQLAASFEGVDPIAHVALAARPGGAWLAWQESGASARVPPRVHAIALDEFGAIVGPTIDLTTDGETSGPIAITGLGDHLAAAWVQGPDVDFGALRLGLFDTVGTLLASSTFVELESFLYQPSLSLLGSDDGKQLLLSWSALGPAGPAMVQVARFSCLDGPPPP